MKKALVTSWSFNFSFRTDPFPTTQVSAKGSIFLAVNQKVATLIAGIFRSEQLCPNKIWH